ncbi:hypothetical protein FRZ03_16600 [Streptomyces misionensis]|uniref:Uncharacterized protein n=1 Tax=Streptomyces misionensis TaxID=67331 RepID=A0A5C6JSN8_9ACTN|nr:hypothetical protein [Streptomyces misionensis]TWV45032.1 hypothetical protein FRZ03_16600 [Streptomyces misionensis]
MLDSASWQADLLELFGGTFAFAAAGPRTHEDWRRDVQAVMTLHAKDPRNWGTLVFTPPTSGPTRTEEKPFADLRLDEFDRLLYPVGRESATQLLVALQGEFYQSANIQDFAQRKDRLFACAEEILFRFDHDAKYYTNAAEARDDPNADLMNPDTEWNCLSEFTTDCGLVVVSGSEVGVFWAFSED